MQYSEQLANRFKNGMLAELQEYNNFVVWKKTPDRKKIPFNPETGTLAKSNDPTTWSSLENALTALKTGSYHGIGFVFSKSDPFTGIDIDHCISNSRLTPEAQEQVKTFNSYTEISYSEEGIHILIKGQLPEGRRKGNIEIYTTGRYFALTTRHIAGTPETIEERQQQLISLYTTLAPATKSRTTSPQNKTVFSLNASDTEIIRKATNARNGSTFNQLWQGNITGHQSKSEADFTLILLLLYWTNDDQEQTKRLFLQSRLADDKTLRPTNGTTYLDTTITNAIEKRHR